MLKIRYVKNAPRYTNDDARMADQSNRLIRRADVVRRVKDGPCDSGTINHEFVSVG